MPRTTKPKRYKATIIFTDTDRGTAEMEIKFSPSIPGDKPVDSQAIHLATEFIKFIGERFRA